MFDYTPLWFNVLLLIVLQVVTHYWSTSASDVPMRAMIRVISMFSGIVGGFVYGVWMVTGKFL